MFVKVNRVYSISEIETLKKHNVDIIGITVDRINNEDSTTKKDSRSHSIASLKNILSEIEIPHLSINIPMENASNREILFQIIIEKLKPNSINAFLPTELSIHESMPNYNWFNTTFNRLNKIETKLILFGDGFDYDNDRCRINIDKLKKLQNLLFVELSCQTINPASSLCIKSQEQWNNHLGREVNQKEIGDLIKETITSNLNEIPVLLDDDLSDITPEYLKTWNIDGVTLSLSSYENDYISEGVANIDVIAGEYELFDIIKITKRMKQNA